MIIRPPLFCVERQEVKRISLPLRLSVVFPLLSPVLSVCRPGVSFRFALSFCSLYDDKCVYSGIGVWTNGSVCSPSVFTLTLIKTHKGSADNTKCFLFVRACHWLQGRGQENKEQESPRGAGQKTINELVEIC